MHHTRLATLLAIATAAALTFIVPASHAGGPSIGGVTASFEGRTISLAADWGDARACYSDDAGTRCYRSEALMDKAEASAVQLALDCSSTVKLYRGTSFTSSVLQLAIRQSYLALSTYGFDNDTSSYKIGSCSASFYDVFPNTTTYPGSTAAGASSTTMSAGWDNRVSSVYIS